MFQRQSFFADWPGAEAEISGFLFYLLLIVLTFVGALIHKAT